jgi:hypothetical protein
LGVGVLTWGGFLTGDWSSARAFNSCVDRREELRAALSGFKSRTGRYPDSLVELGIPLPGGRLLRPTILFYERRGDGYVLAFSDWLVSHSATERGGWNVMK